MISLGSLGQTAIQLTYAVLEDKKMAVGWLPGQYAGNTDRMILEAWEQNYQLTKKVSWENEDVPWLELTTTILRKARHSGTVFALVDKKPVRRSSVREDIAVYTTPSGMVTDDPASLVGQSFYTEIRTQSVPTTIYTYTAFYFTKSVQPTGLLLSQGPPNGPCRTNYTYGTQILAVGQKTPSATAGLQKNDILMAVNGRPAEFRDVFALFIPGENTLVICRNGTMLPQKHLRLPLPGEIPTSR